MADSIDLSRFQLDAFFSITQLTQKQIDIFKEVNKHGRIVITKRGQRKALVVMEQDLYHQLVREATHA